MFFIYHYVSGVAVWIREGAPKRWTHRWAKVGVYCGQSEQNRTEIGNGWLDD